MFSTMTKVAHDPASDLIMSILAGRPSDDVVARRYWDKDKQDKQKRFSLRMKMQDSGNLKENIMEYDVDGTIFDQKQQEVVVTEVPYGFIFWKTLIVGIEKGSAAEKHWKDFVYWNVTEANDKEVTGRTRYSGSKAITDVDDMFVQSKSKVPWNLTLEKMEPRLHVMVTRCTNLKKVESSGYWSSSADPTPYVRVSLVGWDENNPKYTQQTRCKASTVNPYWEEMLEFPINQDKVPDRRQAVYALDITVFHQTTEQDQVLGKVGTVSLAAFQPTNPDAKFNNQLFSIGPLHGKEAMGRLKFGTCFSPWTFAPEERGVTILLLDEMEDESSEGKCGSIEVKMVTSWTKEQARRTTWT